MRAPSTRLAMVLFAALAGALFGGRRLEAGAQAGSGAGFSGAWELKKEAGDNPFAAEASGEADRSGGEGRGSRAGFGGQGGAAGEAVDAPLEAVGDAHRLVIVDDGWKLEITYPTGRKRVLYTDGEEREMDDGDGPAKVTARRKGHGGARVVVTSAWPSGRGLKETWDLLARPRRLVVEGNVKGRYPFVYRRVYEPAAELAAVPPKAATASPLPTAPAVPATAAPPGTPSPVSSPAAAGAVKPECSIRPPRGAGRAELAALARIAASEAEKRAIASVGPQRVTSVIFSDLEVDDGCLVWPLDLRLVGKDGVQEVLIDAGDGRVLSSTFEPSDRPEAPPKSP
jgi:hypothetical protein